MEGPREGVHHPRSGERVSHILRQREKHALRLVETDQGEKLAEWAHTTPWGQHPPGGSEDNVGELVPRSPFQA